MNSKRNNLIWSVGLIGLVWNLYGVFQFLQSVQSTPESLISMGMTEAQAQLMTSYPVWMTLAFGVGTFGGTLGCILLLMKSRHAKSVFLASLVAYILLFIGDITEGIFAALGIQQVIILSVVVLIAAGHYNFSRRFEKNLSLKL